MVTRGDPQFWRAVYKELRVGRVESPAMSTSGISEVRRSDLEVRTRHKAVGDRSTTWGLYLFIPPESRTRLVATTLCSSKVSGWIGTR